MAAGHSFGDTRNQWPVPSLKGLLRLHHSCGGVRIKPCSRRLIRSPFWSRVVAKKKAYPKFGQKQHRLFHHSNLVSAFFSAGHVSLGGNVTLTVIWRLCMCMFWRTSGALQLHSGLNIATSCAILCKKVVLLLMTWCFSWFVVFHELLLLIHMLKLSIYWCRWTSVHIKDVRNFHSVALFLCSFRDMISCPGELVCCADFSLNQTTSLKRISSFCAIKFCCSGLFLRAFCDYK